MSNATQRRLALIIAGMIDRDPRRIAVGLKRPEAVSPRLREGIAESHARAVQFLGLKPTEPPSAA